MKIIHNKPAGNHKLLLKNSHMGKMNAAVLTEYGKITWMQADVPHIKENEVLIRVSYAGICGTDQHIFQGEFHPRTHVPFHK